MNVCFDKMAIYLHSWYTNIHNRFEKKYPFTEILQKKTNKQITILQVRTD